MITFSGDCISQLPAPWTWSSSVSLNKSHDVETASLCSVEIEKSSMRGASLVARWLGIRLSMQGTRVRALVWEDPTCRGASRPVSHNY